MLNAASTSVSHVVLTVTLIFVVSGAVGAAVGIVITYLRDWIKRPKETRVEDREEKRKPRTRIRFGKSSWQSTTLWLFGVTVLLAALTLLSETSSNSAGHITNIVLFTDLSGVGTLLAGLAAVAVCVTGYLRRQKNGTQQSNGEVLNSTIVHIGRPLQPEDIHALAELARALNARYASDDPSLHAISPSSDKEDQANGGAVIDSRTPRIARRTRNPRIARRTEIND